MRGFPDQRLHGEVFGQAELIEHAGRALVALLDALPELALVEAGEGGAVLLALMLEDRADLEPKLLFRHGNQEIGLRHRPLLPRAPVEPDFGRRSAIVRERAVDRFLAQTMRAVRIR